VNAGWVSRIETLIRQLQGALGGRRIMSGGVTPAGAVNYGSGFTVARTGVGVFVVTFSVPFAATYALGFGSDNGNPQTSYYSASTLGGFTAQITNLAGANVDQFWNFQAIG
jgi:hypothetical protein